MFFNKQVPELISLHIPKTAGTSFRNILKSVYSDKEVVRFDINERGEVRLNEKIYEKPKLPSVKVIHGHFVCDTLYNNFNVPADAKLITWLRDPVSRVISNYFYLDSRLKELLDEERNNLNILSKMKRSLIEYARAELNRNRQSKFLKGKQLSDFDFIGITEAFEEDIPRLAGVLNFSGIPEILYQNKTESKASNHIEKDILEEIELLNSDDIVLYREALSIRNKALGK